MPPISTIYYILAVLGGVILVLLIVILARVISMLKKVDMLLQEAQDTISGIQNFVAKPMKVLLQFADQFHSIMGFIGQKSSKRKDKDA